VARDIQSHIKDDDKDFKKWAPLEGKENLCPNCEINHEMRDFLRAMLLRLLDKFEMDERYTSILTGSEYISSGSKEPRSVSKETSLMKKEPEVLRILSIVKNKNRDAYDLLAVDNTKNYVCVDIDTALVTDELVPDSMVECLTSDHVVHPELGILYVELSKKDNDSIKRISDMSTLPKIRDLIADIGPIVFTSKHRKKGEFFTVQGIIIQSKFTSSDGDSRDETTSSVLLRDNTGIIPLNLDSRYFNKFHVGDKILVVGAEVNESLGLTAADYSSVTKTGNVIITDRNPPYKNYIYNKHFEVDSTLSVRNIAVRLKNVIITSSETRIFLSIENQGEADLHIYPHADDFIAIQNKTQFIARDIHFNYKHFPDIPPGIAESLVVQFEGVDPTESIVSFRFSIWPTIRPEERRYFNFTVQIPP
jgi:hypothetical protein